MTTTSKACAPEFQTNKIRGGKKNTIAATRLHLDFDCFSFYYNNMMLCRCFSLEV